MIEPRPMQTADAELYQLLLQLQGAGAGVIPVLPSGNNNHGITIARTSAGLYTLTFGEDPGPNFVGLDPAWQDPTPTVLAGWSAVAGTFTKRNALTNSKATLVIGTQNSAFAAADMAATSNCWLTLAFRAAPLRL